MEILACEFGRVRRIQAISSGFSTQRLFHPGDLREEELVSAPQVDLILRNFARTRRWPALDEKEKFFIRERFRFAYEYSSMASTAVRRPELIAGRKHLLRVERRILEWILIDIWREQGVAAWLAPLLELHRLDRLSAPPWDFHLCE